MRPGQCAPARHVLMAPPPPPAQPRTAPLPRGRAPAPCCCGRAGGAAGWWRRALLVALTLSYESRRAQDEAEPWPPRPRPRCGASCCARCRRCRRWASPRPTGARWRARRLLRAAALLRVERRDRRWQVGAGGRHPVRPPLFTQMPRATSASRPSWPARRAARGRRRVLAQLLRAAARRAGAGGGGPVRAPLRIAGRASPGFLVGSFGAGRCSTRRAHCRRAGAPHELSFVEGDGTRLARAGVPRGAGVYVAERVVDLPGSRCSCAPTAARPAQPDPQPDLALVLGLSLALFAVVLLLARDVRRRAEAERALAEALAFRKAMEDSLITGLRARDLRRPRHLRQPGLLRDGGLQRRGAAGAPPSRGAALLAARERASRVPAAPGSTAGAAAAAGRSARRARASRPCSCARTASASR
jgi:hypothetical protein